MAIEEIKKIREVEDQAEQIRKTSNVEAKQMAVDAEKKASQILEQARRDAEEKYKKIISKAEEEAQKAFEEIIEQAKKEYNHISAVANKNMDKAVSIIVEKVVR